MYGSRGVPSRVGSGCAKASQREQVLVARDIDPSEEHQKRRNDLTLCDYIDQFYIPHAMSHKKSCQTDVYMINHRTKPLLGRLRLSSISVRDVTNHRQLDHRRQRNQTSRFTGKADTKGIFSSALNRRKTPLIGGPKRGSFTRTSHKITRSVRPLLNRQII